MPSQSQHLVQAKNLDHFFSRELADALHNQRVKTRQETLRYIVQILCRFTRSEQFHDSTDGTTDLKPLAMIYADAVYSSTPRQRHKALRRLGDVALFIAGLFSQSLNRKTVGLDYYVAMGENAYAHLSACGISDGEVFRELSEKFEAVTNALAELSINANFNRNSDLLHNYDLWLRTGNVRAARRLINAGITPTGNVTSRHTH
jgi:hypothetical protein